MEIESIWSLAFYPKPEKEKIEMIKGGILIFKDGFIYGGDVDYFYVGHYTWRLSRLLPRNSSKKVFGEILAVRYGSTPKPFFGEAREIKLSIEGKYFSGCVRIGLKITINAFDDFPVIEKIRASLTRRYDLPDHLENLTIA